jgi:hypothetical protein
LLVETRQRLFTKRDLLDRRLRRNRLWSNRLGGSDCLVRRSRQLRRLFHGGHSGSLDPLLLLFKIESPQHGRTRREAVPQEQRDVCSPQFFDQESTGVICGGVQVARPRP